ncbi:hypothetical protein ACJMK2_008537 [Sinanodonta woodiana]|uniref:Hexosyltransferase n=1 Tax=Sinanodonta woodiana TaxID=1069815 RepID=A0ABD3VLX2_SINWO
MGYRIAKRFLLSNVIVLSLLLILLHYLKKDDLTRTSPKFDILDVPFNHSYSLGTGSPNDSHSSKSKFIIGILSQDSQIELREALRQTWIPLLKKDLPLTVEYTFVLDNPTPATLSELRTKQDIVFLNSSYSGYAVRFGEKMYKWFRYVTEHYPDATLVAKMDDDVFLCVSKMLQRLSNLKHRRLYYGWQHNKEYMQIDEMFVVLGMDLVLRINQRKYCYRERSQCNNISELVDEGWGGKSIGLWLSVYDDVLTVPDNQNIIYYNRVMKPPIDIRKEANLCQKYLLYHKASVSDIVFLHNMTTAGETNK